ncbi:MAG: RsmE family RNA methyltransferase, partial [Nannocystaceae bacterium]
DFHFFHSKRVEKSFWQSHALLDEEVGRQLRLGLEQGRDTRLPRVRWHRGFRAFVEEALPLSLTDVDAGYFAHVGASSPCPSSVGRALVVVGPEGGFIPYEVERLEEAGLQPVGLGSRPLRVETACVALAARLALR